VTEEFLSYWEDNRTVFRVVDLATEEGDAQLRGIRVRALNAVTIALAQVITRASPSHRGPPGSVTTSPAGSDPMAVAGTLVAMFASVSAHRYGRPGPTGVVGREAVGAAAARRAARPR
jgi:hypothetical protein